jgi:hypothetical protein
MMGIVVVIGVVWTVVALLYLGGLAMLVGR